MFQDNSPEHPALVHLVGEMSVGDLCAKAGISLQTMCDRAFAGVQARQFQHDYTRVGEGSRIAHARGMEQHKADSATSSRAPKTTEKKSKAPKAAPASDAAPKPGTTAARKPKFIGNDRALRMLPGTLSQVCGKLHRPRELVLKTLQRLVKEDLAVTVSTEEGVVYRKVATTKN